MIIIMHLTPKSLVNCVTPNIIERRNWDVKTRLLSSIGKARRLLGYEPQTEFEYGLKEVHGWFAENWGNIRGRGEF